MIENENKQQEAVTEAAVPAEEINTAETPKPETDNEQVAENVENTDDAAELPKAETVAVSEDATDNAPSEISTAVTRDPGISKARVHAMHPLPVHRSRIF